jgi:magnesium chelatase family protein
VCPAALLTEIAAPDRAGEKLLQDAASRFGLTARGYHRILRLARTLADLDLEKNVLKVHIAEALAFRGELVGGMVSSTRLAPAAEEVPF